MPIASWNPGGIRARSFWMWSKLLSGALKTGCGPRSNLSAGKVNFLKQPSQPPHPKSHCLSSHSPQINRGITIRWDLPAFRFLFFNALERFCPGGAKQSYRIQASEDLV
jgi:hypothetical protein